MNNIFIGFIFLFLDFSIDFGATRVGLIPDFVGYILIAQGLAELTAGNDKFSRVRPFALVMAVYTAILYTMNLLGIYIYMGVLISTVIGLAALLASFFISYNIVMGIKDLETALEQDLSSRSLYSAWMAYTAISFVLFFLVLIPGLYYICTIAGNIAGIVFLVMMGRTKNLYYGGK